MISNDEQLALVRQQISRLESAVQSLSKTVRPQSEARFRAMAEGYVDQLEILREEIDVYLGISAVRNREPDLEMSAAKLPVTLGEATARDKAVGGSVSG